MGPILEQCNIKFTLCNKYEEHEEQCLYGDLKAFCMLWLVYEVKRLQVTMPLG